MRATLAAFAFSLIFVTPAGLIASSAQAQQAEPSEPMKQVALTDQQVQSFIAAQAEVGAILRKIPQGSEQPDPAIIAALDAAAKKYGFANYADYDAVASSIGLVMAGIDPQTRKYVGIQAGIRQQIAAVEADTSMSPADKKEALAELNAQLDSPQPVAIPGNVDLVLKYYEQLAAAAPQNQ